MERRKIDGKRNHTTDTNKNWDATDYPYHVDYCDHFETPREAYDDIVPLISTLCGSPNKDKIRVYDPYYCNGRTAVLLRGLGFIAIHEKRDFYKDISSGTVPEHDILVTNPPYSEEHKRKCLAFCFEQLRVCRRPFAILMPSYVAAKQYYQDLALAASTEDAVYLVPRQRYRYDHPEGTGKAESPFGSLWFLGIGAEHVERIQTFWNGQSNKPNNLPELVTSLQDLARHPEFKMSFQKRPNPRQRKKKRRMIHLNLPVDERSEDTATKTREIPISKKKDDTYTQGGEKKKPSKYRDETGKRRRKRF